jgi:hypothetical protein
MSRSGIHKAICRKATRRIRTRTIEAYSGIRNLKLETLVPDARKSK